MNKKSYLNIIYPHFISITCFLILCCLFSFIAENTHETTYAEESDEKTTKSSIESFENKLPEYKKLKEKNNDFVGWINVEGTNIDYCMMQSKDDPQFYLYAGFDKEYEYAGTLFIKEFSDLNKPTDVILVYGHNMKNGTMFGTLRRFEDKEFLKENGGIIVDSLNGRREFEVTHVLRVRVNVPGGDPFPYYTYSDFKNEEDFARFAEQCEEYEIYDSGATLNYGDKFVMLTTCEYTWADGTGRLVVMGRDVTKEEEPKPTPTAVTTNINAKENAPYQMMYAGIGAFFIIILSSLVLILRKKL